MTNMHEDGHDVFRSRGVELHHCDHQTLAALMAKRGQKADALIVDAPYSERTHSGHANGTESANRGDYQGRPVSGRRPIDYAAWGHDEVMGFCEAWSPLVSGWVVSITDHVLATLWEGKLDDLGRYSFAPLPLYSPGSRVRLSGDGPSAWTCWIVVARPKNREFFQWGTLPGGYQFPPERMPVVGGKPLAAMRALVRDYSLAGGLVCDPCAGGGTTLLAAIMEGRTAIGAEPMREHFDIAVRRLSEMPQDNPKTGQAALFR